MDREERTAVTRRQLPLQSHNYKLQLLSKACHRTENLYQSNTMMNNAVVNNRVPRNACVTHASRYRQSLPRALIRANKHRCLCVLWKVERGEVVELELKGEINSGVAFSDNVKATYQLEAVRDFKAEKRQLLGLGNGVPDDQILVSSVSPEYYQAPPVVPPAAPGDPPPPPPPANACEFYDQMFAQHVAPRQPHPGAPAAAGQPMPVAYSDGMVPNNDPGARAVSALPNGADELGRRIGASARNMNTDIGRANRARIGVTLWAAEAQMWHDPMYDVVLERIAVTGRGGVHHLNDRIKAREEFIRKKADQYNYHVPADGQFMVPEEMQGNPPTPAHVFDPPQWP